MNVLGDITGDEIMKIRLAEMKWPEVQELLGRPNVVLIPVGATEQHGLHLPLNVDSVCATYLSEKAAEKVNAENKIHVVVAPSIHYTDVSGFSSFPGSISITADTETRLIVDITRSFIKQGFKNILFINGHFSNTLPINMALNQVESEYPTAGLYALNWWALGFETIPKIRKSRCCLHADELETSLSLLIQPENVQMEKAVKEFPEFSLSEKWVKPDFYGPYRLFYHSRIKLPKMGSGQGVMGDPTVASQETGKQVADAVIKDLADIIVEVVNSEKKFSNQ